MSGDHRQFRLWKIHTGACADGIIPNSIPAKVEGVVNIAGIDVLQSSVEAIARQVGIVFQNPRAHLFHLRVDDEVAFGPRNLGFPEDEVSARVDWALNAVGLAELRDQKPANLSGGQIQRLAIAAALAMNPKVLVLDEPTASLDVPGTQNVINTLEKLKRQYGLTIVLIEHRLAEVRSLADRVLVMDEGRSLRRVFRRSAWKSRHSASIRLAPSHCRNAHRLVPSARAKRTSS